MSVVIKSFLADPAGADTGAEYISLFNSGDAAVALSGWSVRDKSGKTFGLSGYTLPAGKELRLFSSVTKITLNNSDEVVSLFDGAGTLVDELSLVGKAVSGEPTLKFTALTADLRGKLFDDLASSSLPVHRAQTGEVLAFWLITSAFLALAAVFGMRTIKEDENSAQKNSQPGWNG